MITCGWCRVVYDQWQEHCTACGGSLPPPGGGLGPPPGSPPRKLPRGFATRQRWSQNQFTITGIVFSFFGSVMFTLFALKKTWFALIPGFFMLLGFIALGRGLAHASRVLRAYRQGRHTEGEVVSIEKDPLYAREKGMKIPWIFKYKFKVDGVERLGSFSTLDDLVRTRKAGEPIWVLYVPHHPAASTIYPPLA